MKHYVPTIGLEVHVELKTVSKMFSIAPNQYGGRANSATTVVDLGYPGTLPWLNREVVEMGLRACQVLNCTVTRKMHFDRKNYFYPDNPKNYQITQARTPIGRNGKLIVTMDGKPLTIEIEEMHIEEDTCKSMHRGRVSLLDFNRAGVPLIEIVTKPCIHSSEEAMAYLDKLRETLFYAGVSDCKMEEGSMRCDANISLAEEGSNQLGTKIEVKNISSIHNVGLSIEKEITRQKELLEAGETLREETRRFDDKTQSTVLMRIKETGNDYRYFPEPDIPYVVVTDEMMEESIKTMEMLPDERRKRYLARGMAELNVEKMIQNKNLSDYLNTYIDTDLDFLVASNLLLGDISSYLNRTHKTLEATFLTSEKFQSLVRKISRKELTSRNVKDILDILLETEDSLEEVIQSKGIENICDESFLNDLVKQVVEANKASVEDYKNGRDRAIKFLMGQIMKQSKGKANPQVANEILLKELAKY